MIPKILPEKKTSAFVPDHEYNFMRGYNSSIDDCQSALEKTIEEGVVCVVPTEQKLVDRIGWIDCKVCIDENSTEKEITEHWHNIAKAILTLLKEQK